MPPDVFRRPHLVPAAVALLAGGVLAGGLATATHAAAVAGPTPTVPSSPAPGSAGTAPAVAPPATLPAAQTGTAQPGAAPTGAVRGRGAVPAGLPALVRRTRPDVLAVAKAPLPSAVVTRLRALAPAGGAVAFRTGSVQVADSTVAAVGVDPVAFRAFAAQGTAEAAGVWEAVARGEAVASHATASRLRLRLGDPVVVRPRPGGPARTLRLGALATTGLPGTDLLVDDDVARALGLPSSSGLLLSARSGTDPVTLARRVRGVTGSAATVDLLTPPDANPVAFLTGSAAAKAFGAFSYRYFPDGTIAPDAAWVRTHIETATVPVLGTVTCHRIMLRQLRGALAEVEARGLASSLHTYNGCYVPRFIEHNPGGSISLHTWGIAIDLDAASNYRGIRGTMDPRVVEIFKRWGFRWGGDWSYTDPMHFELGAILS